MTEQLALIDSAAVPVSRRATRAQRTLAMAPDANETTPGARVGAEATPGHRAAVAIAPVPLRDLNYRFRLSAQTRQVGLEGIKQARAALAEWHHHEAA
jgi:hypothetical protein